MKIYHKDIYMPASKNQVIGKTINLSYSYHAKLESIRDRFNIIQPIKSITINESNLIELYSNDFDNIFKVLLRVRQNMMFDACLVVSLLESLVITNWLCRHSDTHNTLKRDIYQTK